jgi:thiol-disulfide isomerase/thioredoxin
MLLSCLLNLEARAKARISRQLLCFTIMVVPFAACAQSTAFEPCASKLHESFKQIYESDSSRKLGLNYLSNPSHSKIQTVYEEWAECIRGQSIPKLDFTTLKGDGCNDPDLRGKVLVLNFWFKSCAPCVAEMPALNKLYNEFKGREVLFIGFASDSEQALKPTYLNTGKFLFNIVPNSGSIAKEFKFAGYPTTYIVDQQGKVVKAWTGYTKDPYDIAKPIIERLLSHR